MPLQKGTVLRTLRPLCSLGRLVTFLQRREILVKRETALFLVLVASERICSFIEPLFCKNLNSFMCFRLLRAWFLSARRDRSPCHNRRLNWIFIWVIGTLGINGFCSCKESSLLLILEIMDGPPGHDLIQETKYSNIGAYRQWLSGNY